MELLLTRIAKKDKYTIGRLYIDGVYFCDTIEDKDRGLLQNTPLYTIQSIKIQDKTAIPLGRYKVAMNIVSKRLSKKAFYRQYASGGKVPRLLNVPGFEGILIHTGNTAEDSSGCIIVGKNKKVGMVLDSTVTFIQLYRKLQSATNDIYITIK